MLYKITDYQSDNRLISENDSMNENLNNFQSDCDVINHHLNATYNFDIIENYYTFLIPHLFRNFSHIEKIKSGILIINLILKFI